MKITREFYTPKGVEPEVHGDAVVYRYKTNSGSITALAFSGKRTKPDWHYTFTSPERREAYIQKYLAQREERRQYLEKQKAEDRELQAKPNPIKPGDIIVNTWGYDQTNIDFYEVMKATANFVWLRERNSRVANDGGFMSDYVLPGFGFKNETVTKHKVRKYRDSASVMFKHGAGSVWEGRRLLASYYA